MDDLLFLAYAEAQFGAGLEISNGWIKIPCPLHGDTVPSFSINLETGGYHCFGCDENGHIGALAARLGWPAPPEAEGFRKKGKPGSNGSGVLETIYTDPLGKPLLRVNRWPGPDGSKQFSQAVPDGAGGWVAGGLKQTPLLHADRLAAAPPDEVIWVVEGERKAMLGMSAGLLCTCAPEGSGKFHKVAPEYLELLRGRPVVVLPDNDLAGERHAKQVVARLQTIAGSIRVLHLPGLPPKGDLADWLTSMGRTAAEVRALLATPLELEPVREARPGHTFRQTDLGNAEHLAELFADRLLFGFDSGIWYAWDGRRFLPDPHGCLVGDYANRAARQRLQDAAGLEDEERRKKEVAWALKSEGAARRDAMIRQAQTLRSFWVKAEDLDADPWLLNCPNGTVELKTGLLRAHNPADRLTKLAGAAWVPGARSELWEAFLARIMPDSEACAFLQRWAGYCLTGSVQEEAMVIAYGTGRNGKGVFTESLAWALGEYARTLPIEAVLHRPDARAGANPEIASLMGIRLACAGEPDEGRRLAEGTVKGLTGGDRIRARHLFQALIEFAPTHKLFLATNHKPQVRGTDVGIWSRINLLPFTVTIPPEERDPELKSRIREGGSAVLAWAFSGLVHFMTLKGLKPPECVKRATNEYKEDEDTLQSFLTDCCQVGEGMRATAVNLYSAYCAWATNIGEKPVSQKRFGGRLIERGFDRFKSGCHWWLGIGLNVPNEVGPMDPLEAVSPKSSQDFFSENMKFGETGPDGSMGPNFDVSEKSTNVHLARCLNPKCGNLVKIFEGADRQFCGACRRPEFEGLEVPL